MDRFMDLSSKSFYKRLADLSYYANPPSFTYGLARKEDNIFLSIEENIRTCRNRFNQNKCCLTSNRVYANIVENVPQIHNMVLICKCLYCAKILFNPRSHGI